jgi:hypothetical protein
LPAAINEASAIDGTAIVDALVAANELPNLPHLDPEMIGHVALARIKEALLAVTVRERAGQSLRAAAVARTKSARSRRIPL